MIAALNVALDTKLSPEYFKNPYSFYQNETLGDPAAAAAKLGFTARFGIESGIRDYLAGSGHTAPAAEKTVIIPPTEAPTRAK